MSVQPSIQREELWQYWPTMTAARPSECQQSGEAMSSSM